MEASTIFLIVMWIGIRFGLSLFFKKANHAAWKAFVPIYSTVIWLDIIKRPRWWLILSFIPVVNLVLGIGMIVELLNCFGKRSVVDHVLGSVVGFVYLPYAGSQKDTQFIGPVDYSKSKKSKPREWSEAIFFAVIAATIIRTFAIEAFTIPTSSLEKTLLRGDFLFVSKAHTGARTPITPLAMPFMHHTMPVVGIPAYLDWIKLPYFRLPGISKIENNDIVVFNYPMEDYRPIDKREHYVKRCVGIPGDSLKIDSSKLFINSKEAYFAPKAQFNYNFKASKSFEKYAHRKNLNEEECQCRELQLEPGNYGCTFSLTDEEHQALEKQKGLLSKVEKVLLHPEDSEVELKIMNGTYPKEFRYKSFPTRYNDSLPIWTRDFYGPLYIPSEGSSVKMNLKNYHIYKRVIKEYEGKSLYSLKEVIGNIQYLERIKASFTAFPQKLVNDPQGGNLLKRYFHDVAGNIKDAYLNANSPDEINHWSDQFYMNNEFQNNPQIYGRGNIGKIGKEFEKVIKRFNKQHMDPLLESLYTQVKEKYPQLLKDGKIDAIAAHEFFQQGEYPVYVNGELKGEYTFEQDYYFMMGDNRHNSADSRAWGFVPDDHIVGKPVFIWLSSDPDEGAFLKGIRWNRLCSFVTKDGVSKSYKYTVLILIVLGYFGNKQYKKRKKLKQDKAA